MQSVRRIGLLLMLCVMAPFAIAQPQPEPKQNVAIKDMKFDPADLKIKVGETVVWTNKDDRDHTVATEKGPFKSENIKPGGTYTYKFTKAGKFEYGCSYHPRMKGTITVAE